MPGYLLLLKASFCRLKSTERDSESFCCGLGLLSAPHVQKEPARELACAYIFLTLKLSFHALSGGGLHPDAPRHPSQVCNQIRPSVELLHAAALLDRLKTFGFS